MVEEASTGSEVEMPAVITSECRALQSERFLRVVVFTSWEAEGQVFQSGLRVLKL